MISKHSSDGFRNALEGIEIKNLVQGNKTMLLKFKLEAGRVIPMHAHPHEQTGYLLEGELQFTIAGEVTKVTAGDSWCIAGGLEHEALVLKDSVALEIFSPLREDLLP